MWYRWKFVLLGNGGAQAAPQSTDYRRQRVKPDPTTSFLFRVTLIQYYNLVNRYWKEERQSFPQVSALCLIITH